MLRIPVLSVLTTTLLILSLSKDATFGSDQGPSRPSTALRLMHTSSCGPCPVSMAVAGDILFARGVGKQIASHGADYPFDEVRSFIRGADIGFCNLECALSKRGVPQQRRFQFRADPKLAAGLRKAGFTVASLANNHTLDFGREALLDTIDSLTAAGVAPVGAGKHRDAALQLRVVTVKGLKVGFLAYTDIVNAGTVRLDDRPTVAGVNSEDIPAQIASAKAGCDCLVVSFHWGVEYMKRPTERQRTLARACIDNGADAVIGHHPHVLQPAVVYKGKPIIFSAGGFVWDARVFGADKSAIYLIELGRSSARLVKTIPVRVSQCRPIPTAP